MTPEAGVSTGTLKHRRTASLLVLAAVMAGAFWAIWHADAVRDRTDAAVALVTEQRVLAQKTGFLTKGFYNAPTADTTMQLRDALTQLLANHAALKSLPATVNNPYIAALYTNGENRLDVLVEDFVNQGKAFGTDDAEYARRTLAANMAVLLQGRLAPQLETVYSAYVQTGRYETALARQWVFALWGAVALTVLLQFLFVFRPALRRVDDGDRQIENMASTDALTGAYNRRMLFRIAGMIMSNARRQKSPLAALVVVVDDFAQLKEKYGHTAADGIVRAIADTLKTNLRESDVLGRIGAEEFAVLLPNTNAQSSLYVAEKLRMAVAEEKFQVKGAALPLRLSIGIAMSAHDEKHPEDILRKAGAAMQAAQQRGQNCTVVYEESMVRES